MGTRFIRSERGQSVIELALTAPLLAITLLGGADIARAYSAQLAIQNGARAGAEETALDVTPTVAEATAAVQGEIGRTPGLDPAKATITVAYTQSDGATACAGAPDTQHPGASTPAVPCYANVRVRYVWSTLVAWPGLPATFAFDRSTRMRRYQ